MSYIESGNWNDLPFQELRVGVERAMIGIGAEDVSVQVARIENGNEVRPHTHEEYDQLAIILEGECDYYVDGKPYHLKAGSWVTVPKNVEHYIHVFESPVPVVNMDIFTPVRTEYDEIYTKYKEENQK